MSEQNNEGSMESFAELFAQSEGKQKRRLHVGDKVSATIVMADKEFLFLDYGGKGEALLALNELLDNEGKPLFQIGDKIEAVVISMKDGTPLLSKSLKKGAGQEALLENAFNSHLPVEGKVTGRNKGGFDVSIAGVRGFCPISQIDSAFVENGDIYVGETFNFIITEYKNGGRQLVLSRKKLLDAEKAKKAAALRDTLVIGQEYEGTVSSIRSFGAFVDIGGIEGLVHISELSHARQDKVEDLLSVGQKVRVQLTAIKEENGKERLSFSMKALEADPWSTVDNEIHEGDVVTGKVVRLVQFGAFIEVLPGIEGLCHIGEMATRRIARPAEVVNVGQSIAAKVLEIDSEKHRLSLSIKQASKEYQEELAAAAEAKVAADKALTEEEQEKAELASFMKAQKSQKLGTFADLFAKKKH